MSKAKRRRAYKRVRAETALSKDDRKQLKEWSRLLNVDISDIYSVKDIRALLVDTMLNPLKHARAICEDEAMKSANINTLKKENKH